MKQEMQRLLAQIAHELRTPLTAMILAVDDLQDHFEEVSKGTTGLFSNEQVLTYVKRLSRNLTSLEAQTASIVGSNCLLDATPQLEKVDISLALEDVVDNFKDLAQSNGVTLEANLEQNLNINGTKQGLTVIVQNLVSNAVKFTSASKNQKSVSISLRQVKDSVELEVKDTGIGMTKEFLDKSLGEFGTRSDNAKTQKVKGFGVGIFTTKQLVSKFGGTIEYNSTVDVGTTTTVVLPSYLATQKAS